MSGAKLRRRKLLPPGSPIRIGEPNADRQLVQALPLIGTLGVVGLPGEKSVA
jgi:hypothetical protein